MHPRFIVQRTVFEPEFFCLDVDATGVLTRQQYYQRSRPGANPATGDTGAEQRREAELRDKRKVVALNKLGHAAIEVRRAWVKNHLLARKTPPTGAALFVAAQLAEHPGLLIGSYSALTAAELLAVKDSDTVAGSIAALPPAADSRASVITLGLVLGALEAELCGVSGSVHCSDVLPLRISQRQGCRYRGMPARRWFGSARAI